MRLLRIAAACCALAVTVFGCDGTHHVSDSGGDDAGAPSCCDAWAGLDGGGDDGGTSSPCRSWPTDRAIRVLFVGNSQIDFWNLPELVSSLSQSAPAECARIAGERFTMGGANLQDLWEGTDSTGRRLDDVIASGGYDAVVIAESIDLVELVPPYPDAFVSAATAIANAAREHGALPILYATPYVEEPGHDGFHQMADPQIQLAHELGVPVAAGGLAWLHVWAERPNEDLYFVDRAHPGYHGSYVSGLVIWAAITGGSPIGLTPMPETTCEDIGCAPISADQADLYQRAAWAQQQETGR